MQIVVLLGFIVSQAVPLSQPRPASWTVLAGAMAGYWLTVVGLGGLNLLLSRRSKKVGRSRRRRLFSALIQLWLVGGLAGLCAIGLRQQVIATVHLDRVPLVPDLLVLAPFFLGLVSLWLLEYPFHRDSRRLLADCQPGRALPCWSRWQYVGYNLRHNVLFIAVPISLIFLLADSGELYLRPMIGQGTLAEVTMAAWTLGSVGGVFLLAPVLIRRIWRTASLPPGGLRDSLAGLCEQMHVRYRDILIWQSENVLANAGAMGLIGQVRYLLISDALLADMPVDQIRAIFAHEVAHVRHKHIFYAGLFAVASATLCGTAGWGLATGVARTPALADLAGQVGLTPTDLEVTLTMVLLAGAWLWGFGYVSQRFERQSDVEGAWASGPNGPPDAHETAIDPDGARVFTAALERVAVLNGISLQQRNWRHGRMADRIAYIHSLAWRDVGREEIDRTVRRIKRILWAAALSGVAMTAWSVWLTS